MIPYLPEVSDEIVKEVKDGYVHDPDKVTQDAYAAMLLVPDNDFAEICIASRSLAEPINEELREQLLRRSKPFRLENAEYVHSRDVAGGLEFLYAALAKQWRFDHDERELHATLPVISTFSQAAERMIARPDVVQVGWERMGKRNYQLQFAVDFLRHFYASDAFLEGALVGYAMLSEFENLNASLRIMH